jgi:hypothetical protein
MNSKQQGAVSAQLFVIIGLLLLIVGVSGLSAWLYMQYSDQKNNVDSKIAVAEAAARKEQAEEDDLKIKKVEEEPNREFASPEDYGRLSFKYPKNWSVYVADDGADNSRQYSAYLHPISVQPINSITARAALKVTIESIAYDEALANYTSTIEKGDLKSSTVSLNGHEGTRLDGLIETDIRGSAVLFKVRDKTITVATQADTFKEYFDTIIKTIDFND